MKRLALCVFLAISVTNFLNAQITVTGSNGANGNFTSLTNAGGAFAAINASSQTGQNIIVTITGSSVAEAGTNSLGAGTWTSLTIFPSASGLTISGSSNNAMLNLNGADNVVIDGRVGRTGSTPDLTISNANTGTSAAAVGFINSAENNQVSYCKLKGSGLGTGRGIIYFGTSTAGNGNDGNVIHHNLVTNAGTRPVNAVYSAGSAGFNNSGNTVRNNWFYDYNNPGVSTNGIYLNTESSGWTVSGNSFYETTTITPTASVGYYGIRVNNATNGGSFTISNNSIGGRDSVCGGGAWTKTVAFNNSFYGIYVNTAVGSPNAINGNKIANFDWSNSSLGGWYGIQAAGGDNNIGTTTGNTIGDLTGTESVRLTSPTISATLYGIYITSVGVTDCQNNKIGAIHTLSNDSYAVNIYGIYKSAALGNTTISNNIIGGSVSNSINAGSQATAAAQTVAGIVSSGTATITISNNTIANLTNGTTCTNTALAGRVNGIYCSNGATTITGNTIHDLTIKNTNSLVNQNISACGISLTGATARTIKGNSVSSVSNTAATFTGGVAGIYFSGNTTANQVSENFVNNLSVSSTAGFVYGIKISSGTTTYSNNIVSLCTDIGATVYGIYETGASSNNNTLLYNSVYLGGSIASGTSKSYALYSAVITNNRVFRNNLLMNARSTTGGSSLHFAIYIVSTGGTISCGYNDYFVNGVGGILGYYAANKTSLPVVTGNDVGSIAKDPLFTTPCGSAAADYIPKSPDISALADATVLTDFAGVTRSTTYPAMGAYEIALSSKINVYKGGVLQSSFHTLKETFDAFNAGTLKTGAFEVRMSGSTSETATAVLNASGTGNAEYSSIVVYPVITGVSISGTFDAPLIDLNGASNVTIDGRVNGVGLFKDMCLTNASNGSVAGTSVIRFINGASSNTIRYCKIKGSPVSASSAIILFSTAGTSGNSSNTVSNNEITCASDANRPINAIYSLGTSALENKSNTISSNEIFNFLNRGTASYGIFLDQNNSEWTINNNSFYESTVFTPTASVPYFIVRIVNSGTKYVINGNYIGGTAASCGGTAWTKSNGFNNVFTAIYLSSGTGNANSLQNNTIRNFIWSNTGNGNWTGIQIAAGDANIGTDAGNAIGQSPGTGSIAVTCTSTGNIFYGINISGTGNVEADKNTIGSITLANAAANASNFYGINKGNAAGNLTLMNNIIGSPGSANSIISSSASTGSEQAMRGIYSAGTGTIKITGNTIANITNSTTNTSATTYGRVYGIFSSSGINTIYGNFIHDLTIANSNPNAALNASIIGIALNGATLKTVTGNIINNLSNTNTTSPVAVIGLYFAGGSTNNEVDRNFIHDLSAASSTATVIGLRVTSGVTTYSNNIIALKVNSAAKAYGLYESGASTDRSTYYFNTFQICGTVTSGSNNTCAFYSTTATNTKLLNNNLLINTQVNSGGTGKHYAIYLASRTGLTSNYNDYFVSGTGTVLGYLTADRTTLATWKTATGQDVNSISTDPLLTNSCGSNSSDFVPGNSIPGIGIGAVLTDFGSITRANPPTIGAWEGIYNKWKGTVSDNWNTPGNWTAGTVPAADASIAFDAAAVNNLRMDQNRSVNNIFNTTGHQLITNGFKLTVKGDFVMSGGATINATTTGSEIEFAGVKEQTIPADVFYTNRVYNITVNNDLNVTVFGTLNITNTVTAPMGQLDVLSATPEIILGGTAAQTIHNGIFLYDEFFNLTIDNPVGVTITEFFTIDNNLTINPGRIFTIDPPGSATITSVVNNGTLNLHSTGSTAIYSLIMDSYTGSGVANVQLFLTGGGAPNYNWHYVTVPQDGLPVTYFTNIDPYNLMAYTDTRVTTSDFQGWSYWDGYGGTPGIAAGGGFTTMSAGKGYDFYHSADATINFNGMTSLVTNMGIFPLQYSGGAPDSPIFGLNLIGNSLTCSIDWEKVTYIGNVDEAIYYTSGNRYISYIRGVGGTNGATKDIPPLQGFIVKANASSASVDISAAREHSSQPRYKKSLSSEETPDLISQMPHIRLELSGSTAADETVVWFNDYATTGYDNGFDAYKLYNKDKKYSQVYSTLGGINYSINGLPLPERTTILPLAVRIAEAGDFKFLKNGFRAPDNYDIFLVDRRSGNVNVDLKTTTEYAFTEQAGTISDRFYLKIVPKNEKSDLSENVFKNFDIYPADGVVNIIPLGESLEGTHGEVRIYDLTGKILKQVSKVEWHTGMPLTVPFSQKNGIYLIEATSGSGKNVEKIFIP
jgi:hypothetical protein